MTLPNAVPAAFAQASVDGPLPLPLPLLPPDNWWNVDVSQAPLDPSSQNFINHINNGSTAGRRLHPDWAGSAHDPDDPELIYGIPYVSVPGTQPLVPVTFVLYGNQSDDGAPGRPPGYPIPDQVKTQQGWMEGGAPAGSTSDLDSANGDRHLLIVDRDNRILYELYNLRWNGAANRWEAGSGAIFPLTTNHRRPDTWTSADAAGLAMLPGLVRYDEAFGSEPIRHAFRFTVRNTNGYVFPASHRAGSTAGALPMGARLRMKADVNLSSYPAHIQRVLQAMKTYGLIVADNGSDMYISGTSDPRWEAQMDSWVSTFHSLNANMFEVVELGWQPTVVPDGDADGLPTAWETQFGLNPDSNAGADGANGDPDDDGLTNAQELAGGTHPVGLHQRYFAEGVSNGFFTTRIAAANPGTSPAHAQLRFLRADGVVVPHVLEVPARGRVTLSPGSIGGLGEADYSTVIESDRAVVVDRTVSWDARGYGSHAESSVASPATTWYLAEGSTTWEFSLFYLLQNPNGSATTATVRYLRPGGAAPIVKTYALPPNSRTTIQVDREDDALADTDVSAEITAGAAIIVERAMYLNRPGQAFGAGHGSAGVTRADTNWFLAEGSTGPFFDLFILIANPTEQAAQVQATYLLPDGSTRTKTYGVDANARQTIYVDAEEFDGVAALANTAVSVKVASTNDVPIIVERTMWWPDGAWYEAHNAPGSTATGTRWALAEGETGGATGTETFILIANTSPVEGEARVTLLFEGGGEEARTYRLPASSRTNVPVGLDFPAAANRRFGAIVESLGITTPQIVVERAMYWSVDGALWAAGTNASATRLEP